MIVNLSTLSSTGFCTTPNAAGDGYNFWTLTRLLGRFIASLESAYGPRDHAYTLLGVEFCGERPQIWYPGGKARKHISVMLTDAARLEPNRATFQLAHEAVHVLSPSEERNSCVAEEGLANGFSERVSADFGHNFLSDYAPYAYCTTMLFKLEAIHPDAIRLIRNIEPSFSAWTPATILQACPQTPQLLAEALCEKFFVIETQFLARGFLPTV